MITHSITPHKEEWEMRRNAAWGYGGMGMNDPEYVPHHKRNSLLPLAPVRKATHYTKYGFALYLKDLPFKKGEYVVMRNTSFPYVSANIFKVKEIQEIHFMVDMDDTHNSPRCIIIENKFNVQRTECREALVLYNPHERDKW